MTASPTVPSPKQRRAMTPEALMVACWMLEYPLRRPENTYRVMNHRMDVRNHFLPDRHEQFNETATVILTLCDGAHSLVDIWKAVLAEFDVEDEQVALRDTVRMVRYFQRYHIVYPSTIQGEQHVDVRHPRGVPTTAPVSY